MLPKVRNLHNSKAIVVTSKSSIRSSHGVLRYQRSDVEQSKHEETCGEKVGCRSPQRATTREESGMGQKQMVSAKVEIS